jgi:surfactin synthase thioesterase subunit
MYLRWQRSLPRWIRLVPVELPGRGARMSEKWVADFDDLVGQLCEQHESHSIGRYALYGHSMGGLIAYSMAMRWRALSRRLPEIFFASASPAPGCRDPGYFVDKQSDAALIADLRKQGGTPDEVFDSAEMLQITLDALRADYRVCSGYQYRKTQPLAVPLHVFAGREDDIEAERILAWEMETSDRFSVRWFDGGHFFIREHEPTILSFITRQLGSDSAERASSVSATAAPTATEAPDAGRLH